MVSLNCPPPPLPAPYTHNISTTEIIPTIIIDDKTNVHVAGWSKKMFQ